VARGGGQEARVGGREVNLVTRISFEHEPDRRLWDDERVLVTPHISGGSDMRQHRGINLFCDNLRAYLDGRPLTNVVNWANGY
jgi:phosphoglycerate dehydrogenase-like enzyme